MSLPPTSVIVDGVTYRVHTDKPLGSEGKEGSAYDATSGHNVHVVVKWFRNPKKALAKIRAEAEMQSAAAVLGVAPHVYGVDADKRAIVMDYAHGTLLASLLQHAVQPLQTKTQDELLYANLTLQLHGIWHNDSHALNYFVDTDAGTVTIIDFGLAKLAKVPTTAAEQQAARIRAYESVALMLGRHARQAARVLPHLMHRIIDEPGVAAAFTGKLAWALDQVAPRSPLRTAPRSPLRTAPRLVLSPTRATNKCKVKAKSKKTKARGKTKAKAVKAVKARAKAK